MLKLLTWRADWSLNIEALDQDHRALIAHLAGICQRFSPEVSSVRDGNALALIEALTDLGEAVRAHLQREEAFMQAFGYADIGEHQSEHAILMAEFTAMLREWRAEGVHVFDETIQAMVCDWLLAHILGADHDFADAYFQMCNRDDIPPDRQRALAQLRFTGAAATQSAPTPSSPMISSARRA
ncbi:bacteriohemerythrin [Thiobaca trueperi]|nr:hemerythrin domain-containing protein [Thiobaca trueperi]